MTNANKLIIGSDHAGFELKSKIISYFAERNTNVYDAGTYNTDSCDYPIIAKEVAKKVAAKQFEKGILVCGTGIGMSIAANKIKGIRAAVVSDTCSAKMSRMHNNANILCIGSRIVGEALAKDIIDIWLSTGFEGGRHEKRISMLED